MKRAHPGTPLPPDLIPRTAKVSKTSNLTVLPESMDQSLAVPDTRKRKRTADDNPGIEVASEDGGEDVGVQTDSNKAKFGNEHDTDTLQMMTPEQKLVKENEMLKRQVQRLLGVIGDCAARDVGNES
jgi:hypothetical protein